MSRLNVAHIPVRRSSLVIVSHMSVVFVLCEQNFIPSRKFSRMTAESTGRMLPKQDIELSTKN